jgi:hypothetical protein
MVHASERFRELANETTPVFHAQEGLLNARFSRFAIW